MRTLFPGEWYLRFSCKKCHTVQVLFPDLSKGKAKIIACYMTSCIFCGHKDNYSVDEIERYRHPPNADPVPATLLSR